MLLPLGWDASPSQGYPKHSDCGNPFIHLGEERQVEQSILSKETTRRQGPGAGDQAQTTEAQIGSPTRSPLDHRTSTSHSV